MHRLIGGAGTPIEEGWHMNNYSVSKRASTRVLKGGNRFVLQALVFIICMLFAVQIRAQESGNRYAAINLVTSTFGRTEHTDVSLVNPWGMVYDPAENAWWVADEGRGRATVYGFSGLPLPGLAPLGVTIPVAPGSVSDYASPAGIVYNPSDAFKFGLGTPSRLIFVTRGGAIAGWNPEHDPYEASLIIDNSPQADYTGAAIASVDDQYVLYVANFSQGRIDAFGPGLSPLSIREDAFFDADLPDGFSPYNVQAINNELWITYARMGSDGHTALGGEGAGYVDVFDTKGALLGRLEHGPWLDAPWGVALAPETGFGKYSGALLVGNSGSGMIAAFDAVSGSFIGILKDTGNAPIMVPGIHGLNFGSSTSEAPAMLFFTAGSASLNLFGSIIPGSASGSGTAAHLNY
jgi:uncharacterized protein (TIGR03118 family)